MRREDVKALLEIWAERFAARDISGITELYSPDGLLEFAEERRGSWGRAAIAEALEERIAGAESPSMEWAEPYVGDNIFAAEWRESGTSKSGTGLAIMGLFGSMISFDRRFRGAVTMETTWK